MSTRRKLGAGLLLLAAAITAWLLLLKVPLVVMSSTYYVDTRATKSSFQLHWSLLFVCFLFILGLVLVLFPRRKHREPVV